jgi:VIT1/CCC1 family predicted Fe2+/Mn2+ transporter
VRDSLRTGFSFGLTSGVITTLGLMVGLHSGTHSRLAVLGGIFTIAIADAFSDALGIHISEEAENVHTEKQIWTSTISTFLSKLLFAMTFAVPVVLFKLTTAMAVSIVWGLGILALLSYKLARNQGTNPVRVIAEHLFIAIVVIALTHFVGEYISARFSEPGLFMRRGLF